MLIYSIAGGILLQGDFLHKNHKNIGVLIMKLEQSTPDVNWQRAFTFTIYGTSVLVASYFQLYFNHLGFSSSQVGYLYAVGPFISIFSNMFWSMASDRYRTTKKMMLLLFAGQLGMGLLLSATSSFFAVFALITVFYFFYYPVFPLSDTMSIQTAQRHGKNFIVIRVFGSIGYAFFALSIGYVLGNVGISRTLLLAIIIAAACLLLATRLRDGVKTNGQKMEWKGLWNVLRQKEVLWFFAGVFCLALPYRMNEAFLTLTLKSMGASEGLIGWSLLAAALSEIPVFFLLSRFGERFKELPLLAPAALMFALRFFLMSIADHPGTVIAVQTLPSVTFGIYYVTAVRYITRIIPDEFRATGLALFTIVWSSAAGLVSGTFGGVLYEQTGRTTFYFIAAGLALVACAGFLARHLLGNTKVPGVSMDSRKM